MTATFRPATEVDLAEAVAWALDRAAPLEVVAGATKRALGRPIQSQAVLDVGAFSGLRLYEPAELVLTAGAATPLVVIEAKLHHHRQRLEFEPPDLGPLLGAPAGRATLAGIVACNLAGPRRVKAGAARDHVLGFRAVSGRAEAFKSGGRVVKNVTGFDVSKLMAGSFGTLAVMTEVTVKTLPAAEATRTLLVLGADALAAVAAMTAALKAPCDVSGAAHLPRPVAALSHLPAVAGAGRAVTALRLEGPGPSVATRAAALAPRLVPFGALAELGDEDSTALWREIRDVAFFVAEPWSQVWRLSLAPADGAQAAAEILAAIEGRAYYDWGGGLVWLALTPSQDAGHETVRAVVTRLGGHATLVRAEAPVRATVPVFQPQPVPLAALTARIKEAFDPHRVLNPGRMTAGI